MQSNLIQSENNVEEFFEWLYGKVKNIHPLTPEAKETIQKKLQR